MKTALLCSLMFLASCERISDNYWEQKNKELYTSPYMGTYSGTYDGASSGMLTVEVNKSGSVTVTRRDANTSAETFYGVVNMYGAFQNVVSQKSGFTLQGNLASSSKIYSGTWKMKDLSGKWNLSK